MRLHKQLHSLDTPLKKALNCETIKFMTSRKFNKFDSSESTRLMLVEITIMLF